MFGKNNRQITYLSTNHMINSTREMLCERWRESIAFSQNFVALRYIEQLELKRFIIFDASRRKILVFLAEKLWSHTDVYQAILILLPVFQIGYN
ncbi:hypothetical protein KSD_95710 [Ktedonobacter sp. SOSP1-85]|nr:hypothetical protein KSD_95710 [Ktedonobacter sp. SOSP1-85]